MGTLSVVLSAWLKMKMPLFVTPLVPPSDAPLPPLPIWSVPLEIVVAPV